MARIAFGISVLIVALCSSAGTKVQRGPLGSLSGKRVHLSGALAMLRVSVLVIIARAGLLHFTLT